MSENSLDTLAGITSGMYQVTTETSTYLLDYDTKRAKRRPGPDAPEMKKDRDWFSFISVVCEIGGVMFIWTSDSDPDATFTNRRTSKVVKIEKMPECGI